MDEGARAHGTVPGGGDMSEQGVLVKLRTSYGVLLADITGPYDAHWVEELKRFVRVETVQQGRLAL